jgi:hypothetical protein
MRSHCKGGTELRRTLGTQEPSTVGRKLTFLLNFLWLVAHGLPTYVFHTRAIFEFPTALSEAP